MLAHDTPLAGHLGVDKTYRKVLSHFYWPGVHSDVRKFCRTRSGGSGKVSSNIENKVKNLLYDT